MTSSGPLPLQKTLPMAVFNGREKSTGHLQYFGKRFFKHTEVAHLVADYYKLDKSLIKPSKSADINQPAKRPPITGFIIDRAKKELGYNPHTFIEGIQFLEEQLKHMSK